MIRKTQDWSAQKEMKKTLFVLLLIAAMALSGCTSLVLRDSAVDARQTILTVNGEHVDKQTFMGVYNYNLYTEQQYAQLMAQFGASDGSVDSTKVLQSTAQSLVSTLVTSQKAAEQGLDQFTDAENAELDEQAQKKYEEELEQVRETYFADAEPSEKAVADYARSLGYTLESARSSARQSMISERLKEYASRDVTLDDAALQSALDEKIESQKSRFENNANAYNTALNLGNDIFYVPAGYRAIRVIEATGDTAEADMNALAERLAAGEAIDALGVNAKQYAVREGGTVPNADLVNAVMALTEKGSVTPVTKIANGFAIAEYTDDIAEHTATLAEARDSIYDETLETAKTNAYNAAVTEWTNAADVQMYLERLK